jgi:hypothetical protein
MYNHDNSDTFGALLGFTWKPRCSQARIDLESVTRHRIWDDLAALKVTVPPPPPMPITTSVWDGVAALKTCYVRALAHLNSPHWPANKAEYVLRAMMAKHPGVATRAKTFAQDCQELAADGSSFSPLIWTYWRVKFLTDRGISPYAVKVVWSERVRSRQFRRFFYEDADAGSLGGQPLWPTAASQMLGLWREAEQEVVGMSEAEAIAHWESLLPAYRKLQEAAMVQHAEVQERIATRVAKWDIGLWYTTDPLAYLKLNKRVAVLRPKKTRKKKK